MTLSPIERRRAVLSYVECEAGRIYAGEISLGEAILAATIQFYATVGKKLAIHDYVRQEYIKAGEYEMVTVRIGACVAFQPDQIHAEIVEAAGRVLSSVSSKLAERKVYEGAHIHPQGEAPVAQNVKNSPAAALRKALVLSPDSSEFRRIHNRYLKEREALEKTTSPMYGRAIEWETGLVGKRIGSSRQAAAKPVSKDSLQKHGLMGRIAIGVVLLCIFLTVTMTGRVIISTTLGKF